MTFGLMEMEASMGQCMKSVIVGVVIVGVVGRGEEVFSTMSYYVI